MSKQEMRKRLASLSFSEKVKILERLRDRSLAFAANGPRHEKRAMEAPQKSDKKFCTCADWEPCGCGHQPPYHCMWCCLELSREQFEQARSRGCYPNADRALESAPLQQDIRSEE